MQAALTLPLKSDRTAQVKRRRIRSTIVEWMCRLRQRRELMMLTDRDLCDIGVTRVDAAAEASKPFWRR
jgi:uncharacterized protein YjiS (DUF1127 family)